MFDLSIVLPTCNRATLLEKALIAIASNVRCRHEVIVVDGASTDRTPELLREAVEVMKDRLTIIREDAREGFVRAANKGFRAATGKYLTWLNDDARPMSGSLDNAIAQLEAAGDEVGFVAMFHRWQADKNVAYETRSRGQIYRLCHVRGTLYANFPMGLRETFARLNYFDERYYVCAADPDLSLKAWDAGLSVVPAWGSIIDHDEHEDDRRANDSKRAAADNEKLFAKWNLPPKNLKLNDFDPTRPCTLRGLRSDAVAA